jgi:hypothetical protein
VRSPSKTTIAVTPLVLLAAALAWGADRGTAERALRDAARRGDAAGVERACSELIEIGGNAAISAILALVPKTEGKTYWQVTCAASAFHDAPALDRLGKWIVSQQADPRGTAGDVVFALGDNPSPLAVAPLAYVLEKSRLELKLMAADALASFRTVESVDALIAALKREERGDADLRARLESVLAAITDQKIAGSDAWELWWKEQRPKGVPPRPTKPKVERKDDPAGEDKPPSGGEEKSSEAPRTREKARDRELATTVERAKPERIVVLSGDRTGEARDPRDNDFDKIQTILSKRGIPHVVATKHEFEKDPQRWLKDCRALLVNCTQIHTYCACRTCWENQPDGQGSNRLGTGCNPKCKVHDYVTWRLSESTLAKIKNWVEREGGSLYTEDWGIVELVEYLWPEKIASGKVPANVQFHSDEAPRLVRKKAGDGTPIRSFPVVIRPARGSAMHRLMRGVWQRGENETTGVPGGLANPFEHPWQVDDESPAIEVVDRASVTVLLESEDLAALEGGHGSVAVAFRPAPRTGVVRGVKTGLVLHTISHFGHQSEASRDGEALESLIVNFLLEAARP